MKSTKIHLALGCLVLLALMGCAVEQGTIYIKDGKRYCVTSSTIWHGDWGDYYERGMSCADGEFWDDTIAAFQEAVKQRPNDQRRARTYGMHFLDEYFPHRELGVIYYRLGRYPEAISELQTSLRQTDSAKAKFYLNKAHRAQIEQTSSDTAPPRIVIENPPNGLLTRKFAVTVRGYVEDDTYVSSITINDHREFIELAEPRLAFAREIKLRDGINTINIEAVDLTGKPARQQLTVTLDRQGPLVSVEPVEPRGSLPGQRARLEGTLSDSSGVVRFVVAGRQVPSQPGKVWDFHEDVPLLPGMTAIPFEAEDAAGNVTHGDIPLGGTDSDEPGPKKGALPLLPRWASLVLGTMLSDLGGFGVVPWHLAQSVARSDDAKPPVIKFRDPGRSTYYTDDRPAQTTYYDAVYVEGKIIGTSPIKNLMINDDPLERPEKTTIFFGYNALLKEGKNHFVVQTADSAGNQAQKDVVVTRKIPTVKQPDSRLIVALIPLDKTGQVTGLAETAYEFLAGAISEQKRFKLVERSKLADILKEQALGSLASPETAVKIGRLAQAEGTLFGTVNEDKTRNNAKALTVFVRFVDVESSEILLIKDVYDEEPDIPAVREIMTGLATKVRESFPLVQGTVLKVEGQKIVVNLGSKEQLKERMKLLVFRCTDEDAGNSAGIGEDCTADADAKVLDEASVEKVSDKSSQGTLLHGAAPVKEADSVITK